MMRFFKLVLLGVMLVAGVTDCSRSDRTGVGVRDAGNIIEGTGTIIVSSTSVDCSTMNACSCPLIAIDGGWRIAATNLQPGFLTQSMHVRFRVQSVGQTSCGPGFDVADYLVIIGVVVDMEPV